MFIQLAIGTCRNDNTGDLIIVKGVASCAYECTIMVVNAGRRHKEFYRKTYK
jgi:hypothetical protein